MFPFSHVLLNFTDDSSYWWVCPNSHWQNFPNPTQLSQSAAEKMVFCELDIRQSGWPWWMVVQFPTSSLGRLAQEMYHKKIRNWNKNSKYPCDLKILGFSGSLPQYHKGARNLRFAATESPSIGNKLKIPGMNHAVLHLLPESFRIKKKMFQHHPNMCFWSVFDRPKNCQDLFWESENLKKIVDWVVKLGSLSSWIHVAGPPEGSQCHGKVSIWFLWPTTSSVSFLRIPPSKRGPYKRSRKFGVYLS